MSFWIVDSMTMSIEIFQDECMIINTYERENGDLFVVFMIKDLPFFRGIIDAELRLKIGAVPLFHWAEVCFFEIEEETDLMQITGLYVRDKAEPDPPAF